MVELVEPIERSRSPTDRFYGAVLTLTIAQSEMPATAKRAACADKADESCGLCFGERAHPSEVTYWSAFSAGNFWRVK